jgi:hypothetical protein
LVQPAPDGRIADAGHQSGLDGMAGDLGHAPARQGAPAVDWATHRPGL